MPHLYPYETQWTLERDNPEGFCADVRVEYDIEEQGSPPSGLSGPPEHYDPGSGTTLIINPEATLEDGTTITLTQEEMDKIETWLIENEDFDDGPDFDDYYDDRD